MPYVSCQGWTLLHSPEGVFGGVPCRQEESVQGFIQQTKGSMMLKTLVTIAVAGAALFGCVREADVASRNMSIAADMFEVNRRVVFYNGITGTYMLSIEGLCSLGNQDTQGRLSVTCKVGPGAYKKHFLGLSDNVTFFVEQMEPNKVSVYHYRVMFRPEVIIPDIDVRVQ